MVGRGREADGAEKLVSLQEGSQTGADRPGHRDSRVGHGRGCLGRASPAPTELDAKAHSVSLWQYFRNKEERKARKETEV